LKAGVLDFMVGLYERVGRIAGGCFEPRVTDAADATKVGYEQQEDVADLRTDGAYAAANGPLSPLVGRCTFCAAARQSGPLPRLQR